MPVIEIQRRMMELGRIRLGKRSDKGYPQKLDKFRLTSASKSLLESAAKIYGGTVQPWANAPDEGMWELLTGTAELDIVLPPVFDHNGEPTVPYSQWFELWSAGGCQRRCDGVTEVLSNKPCLCKADNMKPGTDKDACDITTRLNVMLPRVAGLGVWTLTSGGWNAASVLPGTLDILMIGASQNKFVPAILRLQQGSSKKDGETHRYVVPVIDLPNLRLVDVMPEGTMDGLNFGGGGPHELPSGDEPPDAPAAVPEVVNPRSPGVRSRFCRKGRRRYRRTRRSRRQISLPWASRRR